MKIGFVSPFFSPIAGGSAIAPYELALELAKKNEVVIFTTDLFRNLSKFADEDNILVKEVPISFSINNFFYSPSLKGLLTNYDIDVFHLHNYRTHQNMIVKKYATKNKIPFTLQAHGSLTQIDDLFYLKKIFDQIEGKSLLDAAEKVIALTQSEQKQYFELGVNSDKVSIVPNGVNVGNYNRKDLFGTFRNQFSIDPTELVVLFVGRLHQIKCVDLLLKSFSKLSNNYPVKLVIVGPDGGHLITLKRLALHLGIQSRVIFTGPLYNDDLISAYTDSDFIVLPSKYETFPQVVLEAKSTMKPAIVSNILSMKDIVNNNLDGLLFKSGSYQDLTEKIKLMLDNPDQTRSMGLNAYNDVLNNYDIEIISSQMMSLYESLINY